MELSASVWSAIPRPLLAGRPELVAAYRGAWAVACARGLRPAHPAIPGGEPYLDACFSENIYQWDSCFITHWARYAQGGIPGLPSVMSCLDNFYALRDADGAIAREFGPDGRPIQVKTAGEDRDDLAEYARHTAFTNPPLFSWAEWDYYQTTGDDSRLGRVLPILSDYYDWYFLNRTRDNGCFYTDSFGCGMDNLPRDNAWGWVDYTCQAALDSEYLANIALQVGNEEIARKCSLAYLLIKDIVNEKMWNEMEHHYCDIDMDGFWTGPLHVGAYWVLMANLATPERVARMCLPLKTYRNFARVHRVPVLSAHQAGFDPGGGYWRGSVWPPTNYMIVRALERAGRRDLACDIAMNHVENVAAIFAETGTFWENYAPDKIAPGNHAKADFCGWSALGPITMLLEYVIGVRVSAPSGVVDWHLKLEESHGVENLRVGSALVRLEADYSPEGWEVKLWSDEAVEFRIHGPSGTVVVDFPTAGSRTVEVR